MAALSNWRATGACVALLLSTSFAIAQVAAGGPPPVVGVVAAQYKPMTESTEIAGRIRARERVDLVARVTAFLNEKLFDDGSLVKKDELLYRLERAPFEADVEVKKAAVAQAQAQLDNTDTALARAEELLQKSSGTQVTVDNASQSSGRRRLSYGRPKPSSSRRRSVSTTPRFAHPSQAALVARR
jgi:membrane fusion protein (multidrug efflux system)